MRKVGHYLLASDMRASMLALVCTLLTWPFSAAAAVIVGLVSLQKGAKAGSLILLWVILPAVAATWKAHELALAYDMAFFICALTWLFAASLHWQRSWACVLELSAVLGLLTIVGTILLPYDVVTGWLHGLVQLILSQLSQVMQIDSQMVKQVVDKHAYFFLGGLYLTPAILAIIYLMLARSWQLSLAEHSGRKHEFYVIRIRRKLALVLALMILAAVLLQVQWLAAMVVVACIPFFFSGLSLMLCLAAIEGDNKYLRLGLLIISLTVLLLFAQVAILFFALIGYVDSWINFRKLKMFRKKGVSS